MMRTIGCRKIQHSYISWSRALTANRSVDAKEVAKFDVQARQWWDPSGAAGPLHRMNPTRIRYIRSLIESKVIHGAASARISEKRAGAAEPKRPLAGVDVVDVGCGGGLVTEPMARLGANVLGVDMSETAVEVARRHALSDAMLARASNLRYERAAVEDLVARGERFDAVLALEIVEHVANPAQFIRDCASLVAPGGILALSTLNRTPASYLLGIVAAEYVLRWIPRGTHDWNRFPRPEEVAEVLRDSTDLVPQEVVGVAYGPITGRFRIVEDTSVNYILCAARPAENAQEQVTDAE